jgi:hypothetical protein
MMISYVVIVVRVCSSRPRPLVDPDPGRAVALKDWNAMAV